MKLFCCRTNDERKHSQCVSHLCAECLSVVSALCMVWETPTVDTNRSELRAIGSWKRVWRWRWWKGWANFLMFWFALQLCAHTVVPIQIMFVKHADKYFLFVPFVCWCYNFWHEIEHWFSNIVQNYSGLLRWKDQTNSERNTNILCNANVFVVVQ